MAKKTQAKKVRAVKSRAVHVDVYAYLEDDDILFAQAWKLDGERERKKGQIKIGKGQGDVPINFLLHDRTGKNLAFLDVDPGEEEGPFWCSRTSCPSRWGSGGGQITSIEKLSNTELKVIDANKGDARTLHYALRFTGTQVGSGPPYEFDPDIRNGGGGVSSGSG